MAEAGTEFHGTAASGNGLDHHNHHQSYPQHESVLLAQLRAQIEFYFSPHNLATDNYLLSQLQSPAHIGAAPIEIIASFPKVRHLHALARIGPHVHMSVAPPADPQIIRMALQGSSIVSVSDDGRWIIPCQKIQVRSTPLPIPQHTATDVSFETTLNKDDHGASDTVATTSTASSAPSSPSSQTTATSSLGVPTHPLPLKERNTVIVRDVPASADTIQVTEAFSTDVVVPKSVRSDVGNTWYVVFDSEAQAVAALSATKERAIAGAPIRGRLKNELAVPSSAASAMSGSSAARQIRTVAPQAPLIPSGGGGGQDCSNLVLPTLRPHEAKQPQQQPQYARPHYYHPSMPQPPPAYGYVPVPYPYTMDAMASFHYRQQHQHYLHHTYGVPPHFASPQRSQHGQPNQQEEQQLIATGSGYAHPPPHVYVRPKQQARGQKKNNKQRKKKNPKESETPKTESQDLASAQSSVVTESTALQRNSHHHQNLDRDNTKSNPTNRSSSSNNQNQDRNVTRSNPTTTSNHNKSKNTNSTENNASSGQAKKPHNRKNRNTKKNDSRGSNGTTASQDSSLHNSGNKTLSVEDFPALGGGQGNLLPKTQSAPGEERAAYAQALLRPVKAPSVSTPTTKDSPVATSEVEAAMENLAFSSKAHDTIEASDGW